MKTFRRIQLWAAIAALITLAAFDADSEEWNVQVVDNTGAVGYQSQIAVTSDGTPYIIDTNGSNYDVLLRWWVPSGGGLGSWEKMLIGDGQHGDTTEMIADSADRLHVAWTDIVKDSVMYAVFDGPTKSWSQSPRGITRVTDASVDLAIFENGGVITPSIVFDKNNDLNLATRDPVGGTWSFETVYDSGYVSYMSIACDSLGARHIAFYEAYGDDLMYATDAHGGWTIEYVDMTGNVGSYCSIVIETGNIPYIAYYDVTNTDLKYARLISE